MNDPAPRRRVHDTAINIRVNNVLVKAAEARAQALGMSLSELYRAAIRDKVLEEE